MKKTILIITLLALVANTLTAQSKYEDGMTQAFKMIEKNKINESIALFERISQSEKKKWLPTYHAAHTLIWTSFGINEKEARENNLERAKILITEAHKRSENNAEIISLEAMLYTSYMAFDPATYGMMYAAKIEGLHNKAIAIDDTNLRVIVGKIQYDSGKAAFFGQDMEPYCKKMKEIIPKFNEHKSSEPFAPSHGLEQAKGFVQNCNE